MTHPFDRYFRRHGHYPRIRIDNGVQRLTIEFAPGYVRIKTSSPFQGEVYIVRSAWLKLLKRAVPLTRAWDRHQDFDVPEKVHLQYLEEQSHLLALRAQKKTRHFDLDAEEKRKRQHHRFLRAKARARARDET